MENLSTTELQEMLEYFRNVRQHIIDVMAKHPILFAYNHPMSYRQWKKPRIVAGICWHIRHFAKNDLQNAQMLNFLRDYAKIKLLTFHWFNKEVRSQKTITSRKWYSPRINCLDKLIKDIETELLNRK